MKKGDWIKIEYIGRVKSTGEIFDLTSKEEAEKHGVYDPKKRYGPVLIILGAGMIIPGVEAELMRMDAGESREFNVKPENALGQRRPELIRVFSAAKFMHEKIRPFPGMWVNIDGRNAKVQAVSGGRVRVDFNHPLAGKELIYEVKIIDEIKEPVRMIASLLDYYGVPGRATVAGNSATIVTDKAEKTEKDVNEFMKKLITETLKKWCPGIESVTFEVKKPVPGEEKTGKKQVQ